MVNNKKNILWPILKEGINGRSVVCLDTYIIYGIYMKGTTRDTCRLAGFGILLDFAGFARFREMTTPPPAQARLESCRPHLFSSLGTLPAGNQFSAYMVLTRGGGL